MMISEKVKKELLGFLKKQRSPDLLPTYFFFLEKHYKLNPVAFVPNKKVYKTLEEAMQKLEKEGQIWRETEIKIGYGPPTVNEETKRIYICPFTGKVFADNTHPNPQDAIYDWVSKCPENKERIGGVPAKRFFVSEDPEVIRSYIKPRKEPISKIVYSSVLTGKLYHAKETIIEEFKKAYLKPMSLVEVQNQNRFELEESFLKFVQDQLNEDKIAALVESLAADDAFVPYVTKWVENEE
jgi:hypothetical protein